MRRVVISDKEREKLLFYGDLYIYIYIYIYIYVCVCVCVCMRVRVCVQCIETKREMKREPDIGRELSDQLWC